MRVVVISNGRFGRESYYRQAIEPDDVLVCADGGANYVWALGMIPNMVIGDMDSIDPRIRAQLVEKGTVELVTAPTDKDETDTELALKAAIARKPSELVMMGMLGGRLDHTMANIGLLSMVPESMKCHIDEPNTRIWLVRKELTFDCEAGQTVSVLPFEGDARGVTLRGMKYPLVDGVLKHGRTRGVSNLAVGPTARVAVEHGMALVILFN